MTLHFPLPAETRRRTIRGAALALVLGTVLYVLPSALHGNPPVESAPDLLTYVHERPSWRIVHLVNIAAVVIWAAALVALAPIIAPTAPGHRRVLSVVVTAAAGVFAVYFSLHAFGLSAVADQRFAHHADPTAVLERTESLLLVLGSIAFTAQAMLGCSIALAGALVARASALPTWLGWVGLVAGLGWLVGALLVNFAVIVPFTMLAWLWTVALAVVLWRRSGTFAGGAV